MAAPDNIVVGSYVATATVFSTRRNLFVMAPGRERHIGTLVSGSRTQIAQFDTDCGHIVRALAHYDATVGSIEEAWPEGEPVSER